MTIFYPDIYSGQAGMSFKGAPIAMVKATQGTGYLNPDYVPAKGRAASAGAFFCGYHFLEAGGAAAQATWAHQNVAKTPLMLDFEPTTGSNPAIADAEQFIDSYRELGGMCHLLYLPKWYWEDLGSPSLSGFISRGMSIVASDYTTYSDSGPGWASYGGMNPAVWQYTATASWNGFDPVDLNAYRGTAAQFEALANGGTVTDPTISQGATGASVTKAQNLLNSKGASPKLTVDGDFGPATESAVKAFQTKSHLTVDGIIGPQTWAALETTDPANTYPAPPGVALSGISTTVSWKPSVLSGKTAATYTVKAVEMNGKVTNLHTVSTTSTLLTGLVHGWTYDVEVRAVETTAATSTTRITV